MVKAQATITLSRVNDGSPGAPGRTYFIEPSTLVLKKGQDNVISPGTVDFKAYYRDGSSASRTAYAGRFKIEETVDGTTWKTIYTSKANESSVKHSTYDYLTNAAGHGIVAAVRDIQMIRCTLYAAGGTTNALDTQSVAVVKDVKALTQEEVFNILTNNGAIKGLYMQDGQLYISFTYAKGGVLTLGGKNDGNGKLIILDNLDRQFGLIDNRGIECQNIIAKYSFLCQNENFNTTFKVDMINHEINFYSENVKMRLKAVDNTLYMRLEDEEFIFTNNNKNVLQCSYDSSSGKNVVDFTASNVKFYSIYPMQIYLGNKVWFDTDYTGAAFCRGTLMVTKDFAVTGRKSRICKTQNYADRLMYCYETTSPMFGDIGEAETDKSGVCYIYLDDVFTETINTGIEYQVFLQKEGQGDLWVDSKEHAYFVVKGTPGLKFSWEIKAKQRDYEYERLEDTELAENDINIIDYEEQGQKLFEEYLLEKETAYEESN